jgi:hypothetical protein
MRILCCSLLLLGSLSLNAGQLVTITGKDTSYTGTEIVFNKYSDQISGSEVVLGKATANKEGAFSITFEIDDITFVFSYIGIYRTHLFAVPGKHYNIILPPRQEKGPGDLLNPYFSPIIIHLATTDYSEDELNARIRMFNDAFLPYYNKHIVTLAQTEDFSELDKDIAAMEKPFATSQDTYFNNYRKYRYGLLRYLAAQQRSRSISDEFFRNQPVLLENPAYMELFNQVYKNYFHHLSRTTNDGVLGKAIQSENVGELKRFLSKDDVLGSGELSDLVILKFLYDEFYDDNYSRSLLLTLLDDFISKNDNRQMVNVAISIRNRVTRLLTGFAPPPFALYNRDSVLVSLDDFKGKYVYLNFCSCFSYTCLNEFNMLESLYEKHKDILEIVTIIVDNDDDIINSFLKRSNYQWTFLHYGNQSSIIREYDIRAFPIYYLIDREGKLAMSPAPSPGEEFEARFFKLMRSKGEL